MENRNSHEHIVNFEMCKQCIHYKRKESKRPCDECLENPVNVESKRPVYFKKK